MAVSQSLSVAQVSQDVAANTSKIKIVWKSTQSGASYNNNTKTAYYYVSVNGGAETKYSVSYTLPKGTTKTIVSKTLTVSHNSAGACSVKVRTYMSTGISAGVVEKSKTLTLDTIPRASSITSASNVTLGNKCSVKWTPNATSFYYKLKFVLGSWSNTVNVGKPGVTTAYTYTGYKIPTSVASYITSSTTATMTVYLYTYSDSGYKTQLGSATSKTFTVTVPSTTVPNITSFSVDPVSDNEIVQGWGIFLKGYSKAKISCTAEGVSGSTIKNYIISGEYSVTRTSMPYTGALLTKAGDIEFGCKVTDSRGRSSVLSETSILVIDYSSPSISNLVITRGSDDATKVTAKVSYRHTEIFVGSSVSANSASAILYYRKSSESAYKEYGEIPNGTATVLDIPFEDTASYVFQVIVTDTLGNTDKDEAIISTMKVIMDFRDGGKGLGIGKIAEKDQFEVGFESEFFENAKFEKDVEIVGDIKASNLGRTVYSGMELIIDKGLLSSSDNSYAYFYLLKPFNLVFVRFRFDGLSSAVSASTSYTTLCTFDERFKPGGATALSVSGGNNCDVLVNDSGQVRVVPKNGLSTSQNIYISGMYSLSSSSSLYL